MLCRKLFIVLLSATILLCSFSLFYFDFGNVRTSISRIRDFTAKTMPFWLSDDVSKTDSSPARLSSLTLLPCNWTPQSLLRPVKIQAYLRCSPSEAVISFKKVKGNDTSVVPTLFAKDLPCLGRVIKEQCTETNLRVPRVAHFIRFGSYNMTLDAFISGVSVIRFFQPCLLLFHCDVIPHGPYWEALSHLAPNLLTVNRTRPTNIFGHDIKKVEHSSDVARLQILLEYGGIYLDNDHLVLRSLDDLMNNSVVLGIENQGVNCGNGFLVSEPQAKFLKIWMSNYTDFNDKQWSIHSTVRPYRISRDFPHLVRMVDSFFKLNFISAAEILNQDNVKHFDWSQNFGLHLYSRFIRERLHSPRRIDRQDNVIADIVRHILYGDQHACRLGT